MRFWANLVVIVCFLPCLLSQDGPLKKEAIVQMVKAKLPDDVIVARILGQVTPPRISTEDLISLKQAGAGDGVLRALAGSGPKADPPGNGSAVGAAVADPDDPMAPHDPGEYVVVRDREAGKTRLVLIERPNSGHVKTADVFGHAFSMGWPQIRVAIESA